MLSFFSASDIIKNNQNGIILDKNNRFVDDLVAVRHANEFELMSPERIDLMDVSPQQLVSVASSLIPFLVNDSIF